MPEGQQSTPEIQNVREAMFIAVTPKIIITVMAAVLKGIPKPEILIIISNNIKIIGAEMTTLM